MKGKKKKKKKEKINLFRRMRMVGRETLGPKELWSLRKFLSHVQLLRFSVTGGNEIFVFFIPEV